VPSRLSCAPLADRPALVALKGLPGSGKSTLARALSRRLGWPLIDKDDVKDLIDGFAAESGRLSYAVMLRIAERQLEQGLSAICDSPLTYSNVYRDLRAIAARHDATLLLIACQPSDEAAWQRRIDGRRALNLPSHHQTDWQRFRALRPVWEADAAYPIATPLLALDSARPLPDLVVEATDWISAQRRALQQHDRHAHP
jgi:predicted kinase